MRLALLAFGLSLFIGAAYAQPTLTPSHPPVVRPQTTQLVPPATQPVPHVATPSTTGSGCPGTNDAPGRTSAGTGALTNVTGRPGALGNAPTGDGNGQNVPPHGQNGLQA